MIYASVDDNPLEQLHLLNILENLSLFISQQHQQQTKLSKGENEVKFLTVYWLQRGTFSNAGLIA